jgi:predicted Fe-S protein YdhL (DUF1289 family)
MNNKQVISDVASPCVRQCTLDENDICVGCFRSLTDIVDWHKKSDAEKRETLMICEKRAMEKR